MRITLTVSYCLFVPSIQYQQGLDCLRETLEVRNTNYRTSTYYILMAEAYFLLAEYKMLAEDQKPDFQLIDSSLNSITPVGLAQQGMKMLGNLSRGGPPSESGIIFIIFCSPDWDLFRITHVKCPPLIILYFQVGEIYSTTVI